MNFGDATYWAGAAITVVIALSVIIYIVEKFIYKEWPWQKK